MGGGQALEVKTTRVCNCTYVALWDPNFMKFKQKLEPSLWIGEQLYIEMLFWQFSNLTTNDRVDVKLSDLHINVSLFSNPGDNISMDDCSQFQVEIL